eukprot:PhM_4_TR6142/c0_g1_i1/m.1657
MTTCCPTNVGPVIGSTYEPKGTTVKLQSGVEAYLVGSGPKAIFAVYDIFGMHPVTKQSCDIIAAAGYTVIMPDFFQGKPWPLEPWPPAEGFGGLTAWIGEVANYGTLKPIFVETVEYLKAHGATAIAGLGFCWGAKPMFAAHAEGLIGPVASPHPSFLDVSDAEVSTAPVCLLPTKDDPDLLDVKAVLDAKPFAAKNVFKRYDNMHHGFLGARGNWDVPEQAASAQEALQVLVNFFNSVL